AGRIRRPAPAHDRGRRRRGAILNAHTPRRSRMKAIRIHAPGGPDVMKLEDAPEPQPKPGEAVVKIEAAGVNFIDVYQRSGLYKLEMPLTLGLEAGGTVTAVGPGVTDEKAKLAREAGAEETILYTKQDFAAETKRITGGKGVQVAYDSVGKDTWEGSLNSCAIRGMIALYGQSSGPIGMIDPQILN